MLIRQLPPQSATWVSKHGGDALWGLTEQLLAAAVDALNVGNWQRSAAGVAKQSQPPRPDPIERPGTKREKPLGAGTSLSMAAMRRIMDARNGKRR